MNARNDERETGSDAPQSRYRTIIIDIFERHYRGGDEIATSAHRRKIAPPRNLGDVIYAFRYRHRLPPPILDTRPPGRHWLILGTGDARYRFRLSRLASIAPTARMLARKIPDATPEIVSQYALTDEQALLARIRYNRLIDVFLGIAAYSLQNHLRTKIPNYGQIEIDELYVGVDARGSQYVVPVQAKGGNDTLGVIQTIQHVVFCKIQSRYRRCLPRPVSTRFMADGAIAMFELTFEGNDVSIVRERHYRLIEGGDISESDLAAYRMPEPD